MKITTIKTTFTGSISNDRIFISTTEKGLEDFKKHLEYLDPGIDIFDDIVYSQDIDNLISLSKLNFFNVIRKTLFEMTQNTKLVNVPKIFDDVTRPNNIYYFSPAKNGINGMKTKLLMSKCCNQENYNILDKDDMINLDDNAFLLHQRINLNIQTNRIVTKYLSHNFEGFTFSWSLIDNTFVMPTHIANSNKEMIKMWEMSCEKAMEVYNNGYKSEYMARLLLPATSAYDLHIDCELMQIYRLCKTLIHVDEYMFEHDDMIVIAKGLRDIFTQLSHIDMIHELKEELDGKIQMYDLPF